MAVVSADSLQLSHVELVAGAVPASPVMELWRTTGETLVFEPNTTESAELGGDGRTRKPANVTGMAVSGDISFELAKFQALDDAIEGVLAEDWGQCPLTGAPGGAIDTTSRVTIGKDQKSYLIEKRFPNPATVAGATVSSAVGDSPGATPTITYTGAASVGSGVSVIDVSVDGSVEDPVTVDIPVGTDADAAATLVAAALDTLSSVSASATTGVVTLTTAGTSITVAARTGNDAYFYHRYFNASYSVLNLSAAPNASVTGSVTIVGGEPLLDKLALTGATYNSAGSSAVFTAPEVMELTVGSLLGIGTNCWTTLNITIDSQNRGIPCIGTQGDRETVLGTAAVTLDGEVYFSDDEVLQLILDNATAGDGVVTLTNADDEIYRFDFFGLKPISGSLNAGGTGEDLTMPLTFEPTPVAVCDDGAGSDWTSGVIISTVDTAPTLP